MSTYGADADVRPVRSSLKNQVHFFDNVLFGVAAITSQSASDPQVVVTRTGVGTYTMTYPACASAVIKFTLMSAALSVTECTLTALSATAGTAGFTTTKAGSATEPATTDRLLIEIVEDTRS